ncbi:MAG TPA: MmgE/PrpD family protein [bacterium]|nr:MmgE/PrpD family protein [bacterium]
MERVDGGIEPGTDRIAGFVEGMTFERLPAAVVRRAKEVLYDGLGALLSATSARYDIGRVLGRFAREVGGAPEAQVFGTGLRTNCETAALVNGTFGYYCDVESHHPGAIMHAIAIVGPAALAVGERSRRSGRDVLTAIVVGIDVACRVGAALGGSALYARGFHPSGVAGTFGALAAAARMIGLEGAPLRSAFGLAGTAASGLLAWVSDPTEHSRPFNMGLAAGHGVRAAHLAACGFGGPLAVFEGKYPLGQAFSGRWDERALCDGLGERFKVMEMTFKRYACCAFIHPGLDGLLEILATDGVAPGAIRRITLRFPRSGYHVIDGNPLRSHCAQYVLALAAYKGVVVFSDILHDRRSEPGIRELSENIQVVGDAELDRTYPDRYRSIVEIETTGGRRYSRDVTYPKGDPECPLTHLELREKFAALTREVISPRRGAEIEALIDRLEDVEEIGELARLLGRESRPGEPADRPAPS